MLTNWNPARMPEKDEMKLRLSTARKQLYDLQMKIKEHKIPVIVRMIISSNITNTRTKSLTQEGRTDYSLLQQPAWMIVQI